MWSLSFHTDDYSALWFQVSLVLLVVVASILLDGALERMLVLASQVHGLRDFGLGNFIGEDTAHTDTTLMNVKHDLCRILCRLAEETLKHVNDEFHRRVIVIQHQNLVHRRPLGLFTRFDDNTGFMIIPRIRGACRWFSLSHVSLVHPCVNQRIRIFNIRHNTRRQNGFVKRNMGSNKRACNRAADPIVSVLYFHARLLGIRIMARSGRPVLGGMTGRPSQLPFPKKGGDGKFRQQAALTMSQP
jgi:hypothetical protein